MIFVFIGLVVGLFMLTYIFWDISETIIGKIISLIFGIPIGAFIGVFMGFIVASIIGGLLYLSDIPQERNFVSEEQIYSIVDNQGFNGQFVLGCGTVQSNIRYYYTIKDEYGTKVSSVDMNTTHIINVNNEPKIKKYHTDFKNKIWDLIAVNFKEIDDYILEVPNDTIKYEYNIDLK